MQSEIEIIPVEDNPYEAEPAIRSLKKHGRAYRLIHFDDGAEDGLKISIGYYLIKPLLRSSMLKFKSLNVCTDTMKSKF